MATTTAIPTTAESGELIEQVKPKRLMWLGRGHAICSPQEAADRLISRVFIDGEGIPVCPDEAAGAEFNRRQDISTAYHEACHAVAAWMLHGDNGVEGMWYDSNEGYSEATTAVKGSKQFFGEIRDGGVYAHQAAFIALAGALGERQVLGNFRPWSKKGMKTHVERAKRLLITYGRYTQETGLPVLARLIVQVKKTFQNPTVMHCVRVLAKEFHQRRRLSGEEATKIITQAYFYCADLRR